MVKGLMLKEALALGPVPRLAAVGAGGKTTFLEFLAREYAPRVLLTTSTHVAVEQARRADTHLIVRSESDIDRIFQEGIQNFTMVTGEEAGDGRLTGLPMEWLKKIKDLADVAGIPLLVEADGSRRLPVKGPADHEPALPAWAEEVVVLVGLTGLGVSIDPDHVHRPEILTRLSHQEPGSLVTPQTISKIMLDPAGGLKNIPATARKIAVLNQADDELLESAGGRIARELISVYDTALVTCLRDTVAPVKAVFTPTAGVILAAGKSGRLGGGQKQLLDWFGQPFVRQIAMTALNAHLDPVIVITGSQPEAVKQAVTGLPVTVVENSDWESGQSTSIRAGVMHLPRRVRSVIFLLADQPQVTVELLSSLVEKHRQSVSAIIAPLVEERRANPVLFDAVTFHDLLELRGDTGGRAIFSQYPVEYVPWSDRLMLYDVDAQEDYQRLIAAYRAQYDE